MAGLKLIGGILIVVASCFLCPDKAQANSPEVYRAGATLVPIQSTAVRLESEYVFVNLVLPDDGIGKVRVRYELANMSADSVSLSMAFVTGQAEGEGVGDIDLSRQVHFKVVADDAPLSTRLLAIDAADWLPIVTDPPDSLLTWDLVIAPDAKVSLDIEYLIVPLQRKVPGGMLCSFTYPARPASLWVGNVGSATFSFSVGGMGGRLLKSLLTNCRDVSSSISPEGYHWSSQGVVWSYRDWEPDEDFRIDIFVADE